MEWVSVLWTWVRESSVCEAWLSTWHRWAPHKGKLLATVQVIPTSHSLGYLCWYDRSLQAAPNANSGKKVLTVVLVTWRWRAVGSTGERGAELFPRMQHIFFPEYVIKRLTPTLKSSPGRETSFKSSILWGLCHQIFPKGKCTEEIFSLKSIPLVYYVCVTISLR